MKSIFEQFGGTYTLQGDYRLPNLTLPTEEERPIGVWGQRHLRHLVSQGMLLHSADKRQAEQIPCRYRSSSGRTVLSAGKSDGSSRGRH